MNTELTPRLSFVAVLSIGLLTPPPLAQAQQSGVRAESGSVIVGRDVKDSTIITGIPPDQLEGLIRPYRELSETQKN